MTDIRSYYHYIHENSYVFHGHRHYHCELNAILAGEMEITCDADVFRVAAGEYILIPANAFHQNRVIGGAAAEMVVVQFVESAGNVLPLRFSEMSEEAETVLRLFCRDAESRCEIRGGQCMHMSAAAQRLFEVFLEYTADGPASEYAPADERSAVYTTAVRYMTEHITEPQRMADIARECRVCRTTLKNIFSHFTGRGCMEFFGEMRLEHARRLLLSGMSCREVSEQMNFSSQAYFSKIFKQHFSVLPSEVRRIRREM